MSEIEAIVISRETAVSPAMAWRALTDPAVVTQWFTDATPVKSVGSPYRLDFGDSAIVGVITQLDSPRVLGYTWAWEGQEPVQETRVTWTWSKPRAAGRT